MKCADDYEMKLLIDKRFMEKTNVYILMVS